MRIGTASCEKGEIQVRLELEATELVAQTFRCIVPHAVSIEAEEGVCYSEGAIEVLCIDGMRIARRRLGIPGGLHVVIHQVDGKLPRERSAIVCELTALAIARSLEKDERELAAWLSETGNSEDHEAEGI